MHACIFFVGVALTLMQRLLVVKTSNAIHACRMLFSFALDVYVTIIIIMYHADINECSGANNCQQECTNTEGSFTCSCQMGFVLGADQRTCDRESVIYTHVHYCIRS